MKHCIVFCLDRPIRLKLIFGQQCRKTGSIQKWRWQDLSLELPHFVDSTIYKRETLRSSSNPNKMEDRIHVLMNMAGVYDSKSDELVGASSMTREIYSEEFKGALRTVPEVCVALVVQHTNAI